MPEGAWLHAWIGMITDLGDHGGALGRADGIAGLGDLGDLRSMATGG